MAPDGGIPCFRPWKQGQLRLVKATTFSCGGAVLVWYLDRGQVTGAGTRCGTIRVLPSLPFLLGIFYQQAPLHAQGPGNVMQSLDAERVKRAAIAWSGNRRLGWIDFRGSPSVADSREAALTSSGFVYAMECDGKHMEYGVLAIFQPNDSWVKPGVVANGTESARVLSHEQGHFDISEIGARLLRADLVHFAVPCTAAADSIFAARAQPALGRERALQARYDQETAHGTEPTAEARWLAWIRATLDSLHSESRPWTSRPY